MEDVALAWWHCPPVTNTTSQGSGGLPACPGLSLGTGTHISDERWVPGQSRPFLSVPAPFCSAMVTSSIALGTQPAGPLSSAAYQR